MLKPHWIIIGLLVISAFWVHEILPGCKSHQVNTSEEIKKDSGVLHYTIVPIREDAPKFKVEYSAKLDNRCSIKITMRRSIFGDSEIWKEGVLTQPNGNRIYFDPDKIAEKIIDPTLVPLVQRAVDDIYAFDKDYRRLEQKVFIDEYGTTWKRVDK